MNINKAMVFGNLTQDPELKSLPSGLSVCSFGLATNRVYNDRDGVKQEKVEYHNVSVFGKQAETTAKYLKKGSSAFIEGRLQTRSWEKDGLKQYRTEIIADQVQFGPRGGEHQYGGGASTPTDKAPAGSNNNPPDYPEDDIKPEDIPF